MATVHDPIPVQLDSTLTPRKGKRSYKGRQQKNGITTPRSNGLDSKDECGGEQGTVTAAESTHSSSDLTTTENSQRKQENAVIEAEQVHPLPVLRSPKARHFTELKMETEQKQQEEQQHHVKVEAACFTASIPHHHSDSHSSLSSPPVSNVLAFSCSPSPEPINPQINSDQLEPPSPSSPSPSSPCPVSPESETRALSSHTRLGVEEDNINNNQHRSNNNNKSGFPAFVSPYPADSLETKQLKFIYKVFHHVCDIYFAVDKDLDNLPNKRISQSVNPMKSGTQLLHTEANINIPDTVSPGYGELARSGFDKVLHYMCETAPHSVRMEPDCTFLDIGSGFGKCVLHAKVRSKVRQSMGIEYIPVRHEKAMETLYYLKARFVPGMTDTQSIQQALDSQISASPSNTKGTTTIAATSTDAAAYAAELMAMMNAIDLDGVELIRGDITDTKHQGLLYRASHIYMFDVVFSDMTMAKILPLIEQTNFAMFVCYHRPAYLKRMGCHQFECIYKMQMKTTGKQSFMCYFYAKTAARRRATRSRAVELNGLKEQQQAAAEKDKKQTAGEVLDAMKQEEKDMQNGQDTTGAKKLSKKRKKRKRITFTKRRTAVVTSVYEDEVDEQEEDGGEEADIEDEADEEEEEEEEEELSAEDESAADANTDDDAPVVVRGRKKGIKSPVPLAVPLVPPTRPRRTFTQASVESAALNAVMAAAAKAVALKIADEYDMEKYHWNNTSHNRQETDNTITRPNISADTQQVKLAQTTAAAAAKGDDGGTVKPPFSRPPTGLVDATTNNSLATGNDAQQTVVPMDTEQSSVNSTSHHHDPSSPLSNEYISSLFVPAYSSDPSSHPEVKQRLADRRRAVLARAAVSAINLIRLWLPHAIVAAEEAAESEDNKGFTPEALVLAMNRLPDLPRRVRVYKPRGPRVVTKRVRRRKRKRLSMPTKAKYKWISKYHSKKEDATQQPPMKVAQHDNSLPVQPLQAGPVDEQQTDQPVEKDRVKAEATAKDGAVAPTHVASADGECHV